MSTAQNAQENSTGRRFYANQQPAANGKKLADSEAWQVIATHVRSGKSYQTVAEMLSKAGYLTVYGKQFTQPAISRIAIANGVRKNTRKATGANPVGHGRISTVTPVAPTSSDKLALINLITAANGVAESHKLRLVGIVQTL